MVVMVECKRGWWLWDYTLAVIYWISTTRRCAVSQLVSVLVKAVTQPSADTYIIHRNAHNSAVPWLIDTRLRWNPPQIIGPAQAPAQDNVQHPDHGDIRPPKPDTFDGKGNVDLWTFTIQAYLVATNITNEQQKINFIVALFRGSIVHWYRSLMLRNNGQQPYATSTDLINALRANCLPIDLV
eukprot:jgi/Chrzof1/12143/Cz06g22230.t1